MSGKCSCLQEGDDTFGRGKGATTSPRVVRENLVSSQFENSPVWGQSDESGLCLVFGLRLAQR